MDKQHHLDHKLYFWLRTTFQNILQVSIQLNNNPAPQQTPYIYKYQAIQLLKSLLFTETQTQTKKQYPYQFIVYIMLGQIYSDVDQISDSVKSYQSALISISKISLDEIPKFYNNLIVLYNLLAISYINRQQNQEGLGCLAKAMEVYKLAKCRVDQDCYNNRSDQARNRTFRCYFQGGINHQQLQNANTLTLFYLAQSYTKLGLKDKAAESCGYTLQRQYASKKFQLNDFCHNLIGLAEYYQGIHAFAQALYLLMLALEVLPQGKKKKMRAKIKIAMGNLQSQMLELSVQNIRNKKPNQQIDVLNNKANNKLLLFQTFNQAFPTVQLARNMQQCKSLFRKAKTQYDHALKVFVLDGYVTEHIDTLFSVSKLYHQLCKLDKSRQRVCSMLDKRRQMLQPLMKQLNKMAYPATWQKILVQVSQIYNDLFQIKTLVATDVKDVREISDSKLKNCVQIANKLIGFYNDIIDQLINDKQAEKNPQYYRSVINSKFNIAKTLSKMHSLDTKQRVDFLKRALYKYKQVAEYIKKEAKPEQEFEQELNLTNQMIAMLPNKIDRINYKQISQFE